MKEAKSTSPPFSGFFLTILAVCATTGAIGQVPDDTAKRFNYLPFVANGEGV